MLRILYKEIENLISFFFAPIVALVSLRDAIDEWVDSNRWQLFRSFYVFALWNVNDEAIVTGIVGAVWAI